MSEVSQHNELIKTIEKALKQAAKGGYHVGVIADEWLRALLEENKRLQEALTENVAKKTGAYESIDEWQGIVQSLRTELSAKDKVLELYASEDVYTVLHLGCSPMVMADRGRQVRTILSKYGDTHD